MKKGKIGRFQILLIFSTIIIGLYGTVGYFSFGFDDEYSNIQLVEEHGSGVFSYMQTIDVHPPLSYYANWLLFKTFGNWSLVRLVISLLAALSLIFALFSFNKKYGFRSAVIIFFLLAMNPALLMWCTSLRWYSFFVPILIWLSVIPVRQGWLYWAKCFLGLLLLSYISYAAFLVALPVIYLYWSKSKQNISTKVKSLLIFGFIFLLMYSYQLLIFLTVHVNNKEEQLFSIVTSIIGFITSQISNQGVFPFSIPGIISIVGVSGLILTIFISNFKLNIRNNYLLSFLFTSIVSIISGLAGKFRNLVILNPWQAYWIATSEIKEKHRKIFVIFIVMVSFSNLWGNFNVITRSNTTKNDFNIPVSKIINEIDTQTGKNFEDVLVLTHNRGLTWNLQQAGYTVVDFHSKQTTPDSLFLREYERLIVLKTWQGSIDDDQYKLMYEELDNVNRKSEQLLFFGRDSNFRIKQKLEPRFQEYGVQMIILNDASDLFELSSWIKE